MDNASSFNSSFTKENEQRNGAVPLLEQVDLRSCMKLFIHTGQEVDLVGVGVCW